MLIGHKSEGGMGFKSITTFNYTMLNKHRVTSMRFKTRYFPHGDFLESSISLNPSYVWWSIWSTKFGMTSQFGIPIGLQMVL